MKRIFLLLAVAMSVFATNAQTTKKSTKKSKPTSATSKSKIAAAKLEDERQVKFEEDRVNRLTYDSIRHENERLADLKFDSDRVATREAKLKYIDSMNKESWKLQAKSKADFDKAERRYDEVNMGAKLGTNQSRQAKDINSMYNDKARTINMDSTLTDEQKKVQYAALNTERRAKLSAVLGKARERKLEAERKELNKKNGTLPEDAWIDASEGVVKN